MRVPEPLYYRLDHAENYHKQWFDWPDERKRASWTTMFTGWLEAVVPACSSPEERLFFEHFILDRISVQRPGQTYHHTPDSPHESGVILAECFERLSREGHLDHWIMPEALAGHTTGPLREEVDRLLRENEARVQENEALAAETPCFAARARSRSHAQSAACWGFRT